MPHGELSPDNGSDGSLYLGPGLPSGEQALASRVRRRRECCHECWFFTAQFSQLPVFTAQLVVNCKSHLYRYRYSQRWCQYELRFFEYVTILSEPFLKFAAHEHKESASSRGTRSAPSPNPAFGSRVVTSCAYEPSPDICKLAYTSKWPIQDQNTGFDVSSNASKRLEMGKCLPNRHPPTFLQILCSDPGVPQVSDTAPHTQSIPRLPP